MAGLEGVEAVVDLTLDYIAAHEAAKWTAVAARYTGDKAIDLAPFGYVSIGDPTLLVPAFDALFMRPDNGEGGDDPTSSFSPVYMIEFGILCLGESEQLVKRKAWRRLVGLIEMLREMTASTGLEWGTGGSTTWYYMPSQPHESEFVTDVRLIVSLERPESFA